ncbi:type I restriction enzyme, S subunit [Chryseobacterium indologenes]|uniref:restriction endonuclease subunit S n=1 Tax=Chryseobacterium indologenes TaxID=253 RepID=UPI0008E0A080|nr:restriction endonuclease subunit S [Chryseobacterium indologenes]SFK40805.1 type I restriction enzyme, S subunit [Chryseobacterium indologenes]SUX52625.1 EcoKI restriction-modification system protein HsdS [Chryseobacterium indologenes]
MINKKLKVGNVPNLRFPEFTEEWETKKLGEVMHFKVTNSFSRENLNYEVGTVKNIHYGDIHTKFQTLFDTTKEVVPFINEEINLDRISDENYCKEGDVIFADASEDLNDVGKSIEIINVNSEKLLSGLHTLLGRPKSSIFHLGFNGYLFKSNSVRTQIQKESQGSKVLSINTGRISKIELSFPSVNEQERITILLSLMDERIQTQNKIIEQLETLIKGLSEKIYSQKIRFKKFTEKWEVKKLGEISTITTGSSNREDSILNGEYTFFDRSQDIRTSSRFLFDKEAVIVPGEGQEFIPKYFIGKFDLHQRTYAIFDFRGINGKYLYYHLLNDDKYLQSKAVGSTVKSLRLPMFQSMPIKSPCLDEQTTIANFLSVIETKIQTEKNILDKYHCQKQYLLQSLFI